jgi:hypothetical protein
VNPADLAHTLNTVVPCENRPRLATNAFTSAMRTLGSSGGLVQPPIG